MTRELLKDASLLLTVFVNWVVTSVIADTITDSVGVRQGLSVYLAVVAVGVNGVSLTRSWALLGSGNEPGESLLGLFCEVCNLTQAWGALFASARYFSLPSSDVFFSKSLVYTEAESVFEMSLVMAGVGWAAAVPVTFGERLVAWMTAYLGGMLCTNMFLLSVIFSRRGYWHREPVVKQAVKYSSVDSRGWSVTLAR